ncbi:Lethal(2) giant larvae sro7 [Collariella sp. IMI 366227]|nr:Lethal(2) giant larvae sro7 [Collariella sp. IMI 366227]
MEDMAKTEERLGAEVVSVQLHPRDIGKLLIRYTYGAAVYSFKQNVVQRWFEYVVPAGAPGMGDPDDTALLIAGGQRVDEPEKGLTFLELGPTPIYATSSWEVLASHFEGKRRTTLRIPPGAEVADYCLVPRASPYFDGAQDPIAILVMLTSGEVITMSFPSGYPISPTNFLHPSMQFVHPFVQKIAVSTMPRERWLGMVETRNQGDAILMGGAPANKRRRANWEFRNIIQVAHVDSTVRIWDVGYADEIENPGQLQVDVARALDRYEDVSITALSMGDATGEFAAGTRTGEVVIYRWGVNKSYGRDAIKPLDPNPGGLTDISSRAEPSLKEGLQPFVLYEMMQGPISVLKVSDVGFVAVGSEGGFFSIIDLRGPGVIFQASVTEFVKAEKRSSFLKGHSKGPATLEFPTAIEFGVMTLEGDKYSSIACFVGTNLGHVATFRILPSGQAYSAQLAGVSKCASDKVVSIFPLNTDTGQPAAATALAVAGLREGRQINGVLVVVTQTEIRIFKPATAKGASKSFDGPLCDTARVTEIPRHGIALVALFSDRSTRAYSLPSLKEIGRANLPMLDPSRTVSAVISRTGEVFGWTGPSEVAVLPVWGNEGAGLRDDGDTLVNPRLVLPPRPTISNLQWISGTQHLNERTEKLTMVDDAMNRLQDTSQGWAEGVNKYVKKQKRDMLLGGVKKSFF